MAFPFYLAMTGWEFHNCQALPNHTAWMACHFSPYTQGLSNIPRTLPENALLMVNDRTEPQNHDPTVVARQLLDAVEHLKPRGVVLDFQRPFHQETAEITLKILSELPCPVAVTPIYAKETSGPVFLPPILPNQEIAECLSSWNGREIWLETENTGICLNVTEGGCEIHPFVSKPETSALEDPALCCHYHIQVLHDRAVFSLFRTPEDQTVLLQKAEKLGVTLAVGLYQEFS